MEDTAHPEPTADRPAADRADDSADPGSSVDVEEEVDERIEEMTAELDHLATSIADARRAAADDPYLDAPDGVPNVTEGEERAP